MSAQLRPEGAPPRRVAQAPSIRSQSPREPDPGEAAFDRWLKTELGRLYDATLSEPVPEELAKLLGETPRKERKPG
jgi:hypothetical protein